MANATIVTTHGYAVASGRLLGATPSQAEPKYMAIGIGTSTAEVSDTAEFAELTTALWTGYARGAAAGTQTTTTTTDDTGQWVDTFTAPASGGPWAVTECSLHDAVGAAPQTTLSTAISATGTTTAVVASATGFPGSGTYEIQMLTEVMLVTAGQGTTSWTVTRGANGSTALASIPSSTPVMGGQTTAGGACFIHASFGVITLSPNDSLQLTVQAVAS